MRLQIKLSALVILLFAGCRPDTEDFRAVSPSMEPTIKVGEVFTADTAGLADLKRWEIVVFESPVYSDGRKWAQRIIGLPGESLQISDSVILVNGDTLHYPPHFSIRYAPQIPGEPEVEYPIKIPLDSYFLVGDNTKDVRDSREWGTLPRSKIKGRLTDPSLNALIRNAPEPG